MKIAVSRAPGTEREVSPLELFFDLVYVFAIGQLSHLVAHVDLRTGAEAVILTLAVFYAWYMTAWGANWLEPDPLPVRLALVGLMFASLLMSVAIGDAFSDQWLFPMQSAGLAGSGESPAFEVLPRHSLGWSNPPPQTRPPALRVLWSSRYRRRTTSTFFLQHRPPSTPPPQPAGYSDSPTASRVSDRGRRPSPVVPLLRFR